MSERRALAAPPDLAVRTRELPDPAAADLIGMLPDPRDALCWTRGDTGLVGWGTAARIATTGPTRFTDAARGWRDLVGRMVPADRETDPGSDVVAFVSMAFADHPGRSVLVVPQVTVRRHAGRAWVTTVGTETPWPTTVRAVRPPGPLRWSDGALPALRWRRAAAEAVARIRDGELDKVVLARDVLARAAAPLDVRALLHRLARANPAGWTYAVDGLVGATPELLLRRTGERVSSRVLAGTTWPGADEDLLGTPGLRAEHLFAVTSMRTALEPHCDRVGTEGPYVLRLPAVSHLATDVTATLRPGRAAQTGLLELAGAVHPTAAVGGTPRDAAVRVIAELETAAGLDRGRYAGAVGWLDAHGDGEVGIALRCARVSGDRARLYAGCGLVGDSDPDRELAETEAKLATMRAALHG